MLSLAGTSSQGGVRGCALIYSYVENYLDVRTYDSDVPQRPHISAKLLLSQALRVLALCDCKQ